MAVAPGASSRATPASTASSRPRTPRSSEPHGKWTVSEGARPWRGYGGCSAAATAKRAFGRAPSAARRGATPPPCRRRRRRGRSRGCRGAARPRRGRSARRRFRGRSPRPRRGPRPEDQTSPKSSSSIVRPRTIRSMPGRLPGPVGPPARRRRRRARPRLRTERRRRLQIVDRAREHDGVAAPPALAEEGAQDALANEAGRGERALGGPLPGSTQASTRTIPAWQSAQPESSSIARVARPRRAPRDDPEAQPRDAGLRAQQQDGETERLVAVRVGDREREPLAVLQPASAAAGRTRARRPAVNTAGTVVPAGMRSSVAAASTHARSRSLHRRKRITPSVRSGVGVGESPAGRTASGARRVALIRARRASRSRPRRGSARSRS